MPIAAIYARVSSDKQREESTIGSQTAALIEFSRRRGYRCCRPSGSSKMRGIAAPRWCAPGLSSCVISPAEGQIEDRAGARARSAKPQIRLSSPSD